MDSKTRYLFKRKLDDLQKYKGRHTELITVYVPAGYELSKIINRLSEELSTASNIKSKSTRKNVMAALEKILQHLRLFKKTPETGLAVFCGNISEEVGRPKIKLFSIIPPQPLTIATYRCSQKFELDPLLDMIQVKEKYGLVVMDRSMVDIAIVSGTRIDYVKHEDSIVPGKSKPGGQSQARFARVREGLLHDWYKKVGDMANEIFTQEPVDGILVGGPGPTKNKLVEGPFFNHDIKKKIIGVVDLGYTDRYGIEELLERGAKLIKDSEIIKEKKIVNDFLEALARDEPVVYGTNAVENALKKGAVSHILISQKIPPQIADKFVKAAEDIGCKVDFISTDTHEGNQIWHLGGIVGFLRYKI